MPQLRVQSDHVGYERLLFRQGQHHGLYLELLLKMRVLILLQSAINEATIYQDQNEDYVNGSLHY